MLLGERCLNEELTLNPRPYTLDPAEQAFGERELLHLKKKPRP